MFKFIVVTIFEVINKVLLSAETISPQFLLSGAVVVGLTLGVVVAALLELNAPAKSAVHGCPVCH